MRECNYYSSGKDINTQTNTQNKAGDILCSQRRARSRAAELGDLLLESPVKKDPRKLKDERNTD